VDGENWVEIVWSGVLPSSKARQQEVVQFVKDNAQPHSLTSHKLESGEMCGVVSAFGLFD
jgi:hypothetical protein